MKKIIFLALILTLSLSATIYEDGEDKKSSRWHSLNPSDSVQINNVFDASKDSQVIELKGEGTRNAYMLMTEEGTSWKNEAEKVIHWEMKYSEDFVIFISLETKRGKRYLIYTPSTQNGYMQYGLGEDATIGVWKSYTRNLEKDLKYFDNQNSITMVNSFVIRGSGFVDNVELLGEHILKSKRSIAPKIERKVLKKVRKINTNTAPSIIIEGENPIFLNIGEAFEEPGVKAEDKEDGELIVISSENINKYKDGEYAVIYMATDSVGNSAIDKRYVIVGEPEESDEDENTNNESKENVSRTNDKMDEPPLGPPIEEEEYRLEERELEIREWEKELQLREKEIGQREKNMPHP